MRTVGKIILVLLVLVVVVAGAGLAYLFFAFPNVPVAAEYKIEPTPERLARGKYLNDHVVGCTTCHTQRDWTKYSGPVKPELLGAGGESFNLGPAGILYSKNITPAAIGSWSDGELLRAVTAGVSKDGTPLFPLMPYPHYGAMQEDDVHAVLAYIRSLQAIENNNIKDRELSFPLNLIVRTMPAARRAASAARDRTTRWRTATTSRARRCAPTVTRRSTIAARRCRGATSRAAWNSSRPATGCALRTSRPMPTPALARGPSSSSSTSSRRSRTRHPGMLGEAERRQNTVMPITAYAGMTREDLAAIYAYLRTLKPVVNRVNKFPDAQ